MASRSVAGFLVAVAIAGGPLCAAEVEEVVLSGTVVYVDRPYPAREVVDLPVGKVTVESLSIHPQNGGIANVVVFLAPTTPVPFPSVSPKPKTVLIEAKDTGFTPHVVALRSGDTLQISNTGTRGHSVHVQSIRNPPINAILSPGDQTTFIPVKSERWPIALTCTIKGWMAAWVVISDAPHVAVSDEAGQFQFRGVAPGDYDVTIWHERIGALNDLDFENTPIRRTARGYKLRVDTSSGDLGQIDLAAKAFKAK